jgi:general secretion pathway protein E/type IV pilus assembly protein PilB
MELVLEDLEISEKAPEIVDRDPKKARIGDVLIEKGLITQAQLNVALQEKKNSSKFLGELLVDLGFMRQVDLVNVLADLSGYGVFNPKNTIFDSNALSLIDKNIATRYQVLPISITDDKFYIAVTDPNDVMALDMLRRYVPKGITIAPLVATPKVLSESIDIAYGYASSIDGILKELEENGERDLASLSGEDAFSHPIVRLVNALVFDAVKMGVSDLHFEPEENFARLRYRLDGVLFTAQILHKKHWNGISQRLKILSDMNIADKLSPQDGRFRLNIGGRVADFRVSSLPTVYGENIVLRVLDKSANIVSLDQLGFSEHNFRQIKLAQEKPEGIIIVTGPTGSGKTTTLYSMLNGINDVKVNIQTLEDPVEYSLPMIRQTPIREGILDFADGIRALLRQDPDIIFIGEMRDGVTAEMALKAAMTGHQVYSTLHTNDSFAQRLTRVLCPSCKQESVPTQEECEILGFDAQNPPKIYRAKPQGCPDCKGQGYKGRVAIVEILSLNEELDDLVAKNASKVELKRVAVKNGFKSMRDDGIEIILKGITSIEALARVVDIRLR